MSRKPLAGTRLSLAERTAPLVRALLADAEALRLGVTRLPGGATIVDAGIDRPGCLEAGRRIAEICMGGSGWVSLAGGCSLPGAPFQLSVHSGDPVLACLASQYAGWRLAEDRWFAMASGPGRARVAKEPLFDELGYRDTAATSAAFVLETDKPPPASLIARIAEAAALPESTLTLILTPTRSLAGTVQIVARVLEVALHKAHSLGFALEHIIDGIGEAPLPPPAPDFLTAMGRTNDAVLFGGRVQLFVTGPDDAAAELAEHLPSSQSRDYGRPFKDIFEAAKGDFYAIDPLLFSPAAVLITALDSGRTFTAGRLDPELIELSFSA